MKRIDDFYENTINLLRIQHLLSSTVKNNVTRLRGTRKNLNYYSKGGSLAFYQKCIKKVIKVIDVLWKNTIRLLRIRHLLLSPVKYNVTRRGEMERNFEIGTLSKMFEKYM